jgi:hypothetical protein
LEEPSDTGPSADRFRLTVDVDAFDVAYDPTQPGAYHYTRLTGPAPGYGFTSRRSDHARSTKAEHVKEIRSFLDLVDPVTGYMVGTAEPEHHEAQSSLARHWQPHHDYDPSMQSLLGCCDACCLHVGGDIK